MSAVDADSGKMMKNITFSASFFRELFWFVVMVGSWLMTFPCKYPA
ncbi:hypothetical protein A670_03117 [Salmonella enterica subsp. enterica serovar Dublin str. UC16]|uniref:Uncharacterized protein n=2 Tax=Salmonella dublin TaxID=98360 RepID=M7S9Q6_SALDU|nr:hypothetical protein SD3246_4747 [Salmonella enterica subsp. enterica serovar Dublin str. SD3246]EMR51665.1 hypothetical protein A670_03117 [Salmonella enterica subsp. enterica serovar Dublin str. UC16]